MAGFWFAAAACARWSDGDRANTCLPTSSRECGGMVDRCAAPRQHRVSVAWVCYSNRSSPDWITFAWPRFLDEALSDSRRRHRGARSRDRLTRPGRILDRRTHVRTPRNPYPRNASTIDLDHSGKGLAEVRLYFAAASLYVSSNLR